MIAADESDYVCSCNCDSLRGHVLKYIFNLHDLVMFLVLLSFICGWTHMRDKAISRTWVVCLFVFYFFLNILFSFRLFIFSTSAQTYVSLLPMQHFSLLFKFFI